MGDGRRREAPIVAISISPKTEEPDTGTELRVRAICCPRRRKFDALIQWPVFGFAGHLV
jgi:hypothetical protein